MHGLLQAYLERRGSATVLTRQLARYPLRLLEPLRPDGYSGALVYVGMVAGGVQAGDSLDLEFDLGCGAQALVTTQSATKILTMPSGEATQRNSFNLEAQAILEYLPDEIIPFAKSNFTQETRVHMAPTAVLILVELLTPGRMARKEYFEFRSFTSRVCVHRGGRVVMWESATLKPSIMHLSGTALLGGRHYYGTLAVLAPLADAALADQLHTALAERNEILGSASAGAEIVVARVLGTSLETTKAAMRRIWQLARRYVIGQSLSHVPGKIIF
ncbi:MAG: urease accessory protein UreD [Chloroflexota bacterium]|nr:urease accessory protein UreD [Chloroflexota bacterium]